MNVYDFDEAYQKLEYQGFRKLYGAYKVDTKTSRSAMMISESGFVINLILYYTHSGKTRGGKYDDQKDNPHR